MRELHLNLYVVVIVVFVLVLLLYTQHTVKVRERERERKRFVALSLLLKSLLWKKKAKREGASFFLQYVCCGANFLNREPPSHHSRGKRKREESERARERE